MLDLRRGEDVINGEIYPEDELDEEGFFLWYW